MLQRHLVVCQCYANAHVQNKTIARLKYDGYTIHRYVYMTKVIHEFEPTCIEEVVGKTNWDATLDEEMVAFDANHTWELVALPHGKKDIG